MHRIALCLLLVTLPALADKRAFTIADYYRLKTVGSPALSPDGTWVAYSVATTDLTASKKSVNLWRVDADGRNARPLTFSDSNNDSPAFSPDGRSLAFLSHRSGDPQIWTLPVAGGEPEKRTDVPGGVGSFLFSPDGKRIAFAADVYPECGADAACNRKIDDAREKGKLKVHVADELLYRHWTDWSDGKRTHVLVLDLASNAVTDATPGSFPSPVFSVGGGANYCFSSDGKALVVTSNRDPDQAQSTNADLWMIPLDGEPKAVNLTHDNPGWDGQPRPLPGTPWLVYRYQQTARYESDRFLMGLIDPKTGTKRALTAAFDDNVTDFAVSRDGKRIWFTGEVKGRTPLHELDLSTGKTRELTAVGLIDAFDVAADGSFAVLARRRVGNPLELYRVGIGSAGETRLTTHNKAVEDEVDIRPVEEEWVDGADGKKVQVFLVKPHGFDPAKKYPVILNIHGGPQQQWADSFRGDWQVYPGAGYVVAFPNPHGSTGRGASYTAAISGDWSGKVMEDLQRVTKWLTRQPWADSARMGAMGWSWGGYAVMWMEGHNEAFGFKALASMMGVYDLRAMYSATEEVWFPEWDLKGAPWVNPQLYRRDSPSEYVKSYKTPCLVVTGEKDYRVPYTQSLEFFTDLQLMKVPSRLVVFEKAGHWPAWYEMALYYNAHLEWFHKWLGGGAAPWDTVQMSRSLAF